MNDPELIYLQKQMDDDRAEKLERLYREAVRPKQASSGPEPTAPRTTGHKPRHRGRERRFGL